MFFFLDCECVLFQVILANKGDIDAVYSLLPSDTLFGPQFKFLPSQGIVVPGSYQAIKVTVRTVSKIWTI